MRTAVRKSVMSGRSKSETTTRLRFLADRRTTITLSSLFLGILVTPLAGVQNRVRAQDLSGQDQVVTYFLHHHL